MKPETQWVIIILTILLITVGLIFFFGKKDTTEQPPQIPSEYESKGPLPQPAPLAPQQDWNEWCAQQEPGVCKG